MYHFFIIIYNISYKIFQLDFLGLQLFCANSSSYTQTIRLKNSSELSSLQNIIFNADLYIYLASDTFKHREINTIGYLIDICVFNERLFSPGYIYIYIYIL